MHQDMIDFKKLLQAQESVPMFLNDVSVSTAEEKSNFIESIMTLYEEESITSVPTCQCRHLRSGKFHKDICPKCNTSCEYETERNIDNELWIRAPEGITALFNPNFYIQLEDFLTKGSNNLLQYIINTSVKNNGRVPWFDAFDATGIPRGYNHFIDNFDEVMEAVYRIVRDDRRKRIPDMREFIAAYRDRIFTPYLTVPNRMAFVIENNAYNKWADKTIESGVNALLTIVSADNTIGGRDKALSRKENLVAAAHRDYADFWIEFIAKRAGKKHGYLRQEIFGQRGHFTFRGVITSLTGRHIYDECHLPWKMGVQLFRDHLISKLLRGTVTRPPMSPRHAYSRVMLAVNNHDPLIERLLNELITEHPSNKGIPIILQRNPSLKRGSAQQLFITRFKRDLSDYTIGLSVLILTAYNADQLV
jgi:hypothetical protein